eukprot:CAMPEP_0204919674 /NCGR_PEP_ID=MMETSP1397-20131031/16955_1 /ASSEMBLY_ACC=CAM_ASM_000891 /TAXON_ID=49980 /ORGANISM="Climacostomum Climacostomum virens, Strain Stock W-24" /LENGTH=250 /DNA_ID=CAMNT_0052093289 /DNA_START=1246 /DNA_END=1994 /DNA_ORIENTATION=+
MFVGCSQFVVVASTLGISLTIENSNFDSNVGLLRWAPTSNDAPSIIDIKGSSIKSCLGPCIVVQVASASTSKHQLSLSSTNFSSCASGLVLSLKSTNASISSCTFSQTKGIALLLSAFDLPVYLANTKFSNTRATSVYVPKLSTLLSLNNCEFSDITNATGMFVLNEAFDSKSLVSLVGCKFLRIQSPTVAIGGIYLTYTVVSFESCTFTDTTALQYDAMFFLGGVLKINDCVFSQGTARVANMLFYYAT